MYRQVPEGAIRFELSAAEVAEAIAEASGEIAAAEDIPVPDELLPEAEVEILIAQQRPAYVALDGDPEVCPPHRRHWAPARRQRILCLSSSSMRMMQCHHSIHLSITRRLQFWGLTGCVLVSIHCPSLHLAPTSKSASSIRAPQP